MRSDTLLRLMVGFYILLFFSYLFGPLILMSLSAFNSSSFPRVSPWECFTLEWFDVLSKDAKLMQGLKNSLIIGAGVVVLSVPIGLAAAMMLTQLGRRVRSFYYTIVISPILVPGVVLGISTLIFWDRMGTMLDAGYNSFFYDGIFLTIIGQSTFISAYSMLVFIARLQRFDPALEEAALDLGATHAQTFRKILLPFLKPAIGSAAVLAFLASFENYNTTVFTIISESTLTTVLASKVRYGINPSVSALAVIIVALTLVGAVTHEIMKRREQARERALAMEGSGIVSGRRSRLSPTSPAAVMILLVFLAGLGTVWMASSYDTGACKEQVKQERQFRTTIEQAPGSFLQRMDEGITPAPGATGPGSTGSREENNTYQGIFDPGNLGKQLGAPDAPAETAPSPTGSREENNTYQGIFDPNNLGQQVNPGN